MAKKIEYAITLSITKTFTAYVKAESAKEAEDIVMQKYANGKYDKEEWDEDGVGVSDISEA